MSDYVPTPSFSERKAARRSAHSRSRSREVLNCDEDVVIISCENVSSNSKHVAAAEEKKKPVKPLAPLPDVIRQHRLPLTMKSHGDSLQVYLRSYARTNEEGILVYDIEFDDGAIKENVHRAALHIPAATSYQMLQLQESQTSVRTPTREERRTLRRNR